MDTTIFLIASSLGTMAFALSGYLQAVRKELDVMSLFIMAFITANGGGIVRDVLLGQIPVVLTDISVLYLVSIIYLVALITRIERFNSIERKWFFVLSDSIGFVAFSITGALTGINAGLSPFGVIVIAAVTSLGGGVIRDTLLNEVPTFFYSGFYVSVAISVTLMLLLIDHFYILDNTTISAVFVAGFIIRMVSYKYNWNLPVLRKG